MRQTHQQLLGGALSLGLGLCLLLWLIPNWVEPDPDLRLPAKLVPQVVAIGLLLCGAAMLIRAFRRQATTPDQVGAGFDDGEFRGFLVMLSVLLAATIGFQLFHFLVVAPLLVAVAMWLFSPIRPVTLVLTSALGPLAIWFLATHVLGRVLP